VSEITASAYERQILVALHTLETARWPEVLDFIGYLRHSSAAELPMAERLRASDLAYSDLAGMWADRNDLGDSLVYARQLRSEAEQRRGRNDASA